MVEVLVGDTAAFNRVYVAPTSTETLSLDGMEVAVEREEYGAVRHVFHDPADPERWVTFIDYVSEFPNREVQAGALDGILVPILSSFAFNGSVESSVI